MAIRDSNPTYQERRKKFIDEMINTDGNKHQSAIKAGVKPCSAGVTANRLMKDETVLEELKDARNELKKKACEILGISNLTKMQILWKHAKKAKPVDSIKAIAELNRMTGDYEPAETKSDITSAGEALSSVVILPENQRDEVFKKQWEMKYENS